MKKEKIEVLSKEEWMVKEIENDIQELKYYMPDVDIMPLDKSGFLSTHKLLTEALRLIEEVHSAAHIRRVLNETI